MNLELKNIKFHDELSRNSSAFTADLYVDGKKTAWAMDAGDGALITVAHYQGGKELTEQARKYCESRPEFKQMDPSNQLEGALEHFVMDLYMKHLEKLLANEKLSQLIKVHQKSAIVYGSDEKLRKRPLSDTIRNLLRTDKGRLEIFLKVEMLKGVLKPGQTIRNTNINEFLFPEKAFQKKLNAGKARSRKSPTKPKGRNT